MSRQRRPLPQLLAGAFKSQLADASELDTNGLPQLYTVD